MTNIQNEGSITFWISHPHNDWPLNGYGYDFGRLNFPQFGIALSVVKNPDRTLEITISGPLYRTYVLKNRIQDSIIKNNRLFIAITWKYPKVTLYVNAQNTQTVDISPIEINSLEFEIRGGEKILFSVISEILKDLGVIFNTVSAFQDAENESTLRNILKYQLNENKFSLVESKEGSFMGKIKGPKKVLEFVKQNFKSFLAVIHGYSKKLADNYVKGKELDTDLKEEKLKQEKLETIASAIDVAEKIGNVICRSQNNLSEQERKELISQYFIAPMRSIATTLIENNLTMSIKTNDEN
jgi:ribosomal protein S13